MSQNVNNSYDKVCSGANRVFKYYLGNPVGKSYRKDMYFKCHVCGKPKLGVNEEKRVAHCFPCGWSGNAVTLIQEIENFTVKEALAKGLDILGIVTEPQVDTSSFSRPELPIDNLEVFTPLKHSIYFSIYFYFLNNNAKSINYYRQHLLDKNIKSELPLDIIVSRPDLNVVDELRRTYPMAAIASCPGFIRVNGDVQFYLDDHIIFPYWEPYRRFITAFNGRRKSDDAKGPRYKWLIGEKKRLYFPQGVTPQNVVMITEGEKKALTATILGIPTVGVSGVDCFRNEDTLALRPVDHKLYICYDRDSENVAVSRAENRLAWYLVKNEIVDNDMARIVELPKGHKLDDYLAEFGIDSFRNLMKAADEKATPNWVHSSG